MQTEDKGNSSRMHRMVTVRKKSENSIKSARKFGGVYIGPTEESQHSETSSNIGEVIANDSSSEDSHDFEDKIDRPRKIDDIEELKVSTLHNSVQFGTSRMYPNWVKIVKISIYKACFI